MDLDARGFTGRISDNDLRLLRIFATIVRNGSFVAAESELQIGLPSISRYVKDLEIRIGVRLCDRGRRGFSLTPEGEQVYAASLRLFADLGNFEDLLRGIHASPAGVVRVGLCSTLVTSRLRMPPIVSAYRSEYPNVQVNLTFKTSDLVEQDIIDGKLDVGIIFVRRRIDQILYQFLCEEENGLYCSRDHPIFMRGAEDVRISDLENFDFVGYPFPHGMRRMGVDGLLRRTSTVDSVDLVAMMIESGHFMGFLPRDYVERYCPDGMLHPILDDELGFSDKVELVARHGNLSPIVKSFVDWTLREASGDRPL